METSYFKWQFRFFTLMGTHMIPAKNTPKSRLFSLVQMLVFPWYLLPLGYSAFKAYPDIVLTCGHMGIFFGYVISVTKLHTFHFQFRDFENILSRICILDHNITEDEKPIVQKASDFAQKMCVFNGISLVGGSASSLLMPVLVPIHQFFNGMEDIVWPLPYNCVLPFDLKYPIIHIFIYVLVTYFGILICMLGNAVDSVFLESSLIVGVHFQILRNRLSKIDFKDQNCKFNLIELFKYHKDILQASNSIYNAYRVGLFLYLLVASVPICTMLFSITKVYHEMGSLIFYLGFAVSSFLQVFFYAYGGQRLEEQSEQIITGIYNSNWTEATPKQRKFIIPFIIRAQKQCLFKMIFYEIDLTLFVKIVAASFSYITLLQSLAEI